VELTVFKEEVNNIWKKATSGSTPKHLSFQLDLYRKLLSFFQAGDYYYYIFNIKTSSLDLVSDGIETVLGYTPSEMTLQFLMDKLHPEDRPLFLNFEFKAVEFLSQLPVEKLMDYKVKFDFRLRRKDNKYIRILHQAIVVEHDPDGLLLRTLGLHTDITHLKPDGRPVLSFIGLNGEPSYIDVDVQKVFSVSKETLSRREKQVLTLLIEGKLSKEIGEILNISKQTVDRHRKNMIGKNGLKNTAELVSNAIKKGWI